jgi:hypothetical protein
MAPPTSERLDPVTRWLSALCWSGVRRAGVEGPRTAFPATRDWMQRGQVVTGKEIVSPPRARSRSR